MAYYYYYQQHHTPSGSLSPVTMASELTPSLPPLLLLSPQQQQQQQQPLTLPLVTPVLPSVTTSLPMTTTAATVEYNQQQQLLTPKLSPFLRHCEETGLFQDLRNIGAISSLTGPPGDTTTNTVPVTTTATMVSTRSTTELPSNSSLFSLSSSGILTRMSNPFEETFKQAVLQKQKCDSKLAENLFSVNNNDTNGDLNTPFISTSTTMNSSNNQNNSTLTIAALPVDMITTAVVATPITVVESMTSNTSTVPQPQQQNLFMTTSATESTSESVLVMMMDQQQQQQHNSIISINPQNQHHHSGKQRQQFIIPITTNITSSTYTTTANIHNKDCSNSKGDKGKNDKPIIVEKETTTIKQTLKQNLLVKRQMQERQKYPLVLETHHNSGQLQLDNLDIDISTTDVPIENMKNCDDHVQEGNTNQKQQLQQKQKQELLERNRSAAKRCRLKRKQRWELLSEENRRLKIENIRLRDILTKLISSGYGGQQQTTVLQVQQCQKQLHQAGNQNTCISEKNV